MEEKDAPEEAIEIYVAGQREVKREGEIDLVELEI